MAHKTAIVIIDLQNDFKHIISQNMIDNIKKLIRYATIFKIPILWIKSNYDVSATKFCNDTDRLNGTHTGKPLCVKNTHGSEIIDEFIEQVTLPNNYLLIKTYYSAFTETQLDNILKTIDVKKLIFCGLTINTCVKATILSANNLGYDCSVLSDCVSAFSIKALTNGLNDIQNICGVFELDKFTNNFNLFCEGDTFILNDILPTDLFTDKTFETLETFDTWRQMKIKGSVISRSIDIQAIIEDDLVPVYRNPNDEYIEAKPANEIVKSYIRWLNANLNLDGHKCNHVFMKYYKSPHDGIGKHSDKTLDLEPNSYILNLSLGAERKMTFTDKITGNKVVVPMKSNSCLVIGMKTNQKWLHEVKPDKRNDKEKTSTELAFFGKRMSWTFRTVSTFYDKKNNTLIGLGAPTLNNEHIDDKDKMIIAFGEENKDPYFDREKYYKNGFYAMST